MSVQPLFKYALLLLVSALAAVYLHQVGQLSVIRQASAFKTFFEPEEKVRIALHRSEVRLVRSFMNTNELEWCGQMVDVIERRSEGDSLIVIAYADRAETEFKKLVPWLFDEQPAPFPTSSRHKKYHKISDKWVHDTFTFCFPDKSVTQPAYFPALPICFQELSLDVPSPPPCLIS